MPHALLRLGFALLLTAAAGVRADSPDAHAASDMFLTAADANGAVAELMHRVKLALGADAVDASHCFLVSMSPYGAEPPEAYARATLQVRVRCGAREPLDRLLGELESERPLQFMATLSLVAQPNYAPTGRAGPATLLDLHFTLSGYLRGNADKQPVTAAEFSASKQDRLPRMRGRLREVYERLPPDAVLERLDAGLQPNRVQLFVLSADAPACIASLRQSRMLADATVLGPLQPDVRVKKDRFVVELKFSGLP